MQLSRLLPAETTGSSAGVVQLVLLAIPLLMLVAVLLMSRRRQRAAEEAAAAVGVGDKVVTASGLLGRVVSLGEDVARLEVSPGVVVEMHRRAVISTVTSEDDAAHEPAGSTAATARIDTPAKEL